MENIYNDGCETYTMMVVCLLLGSVWLYVSWFPQQTCDHGYKVGKALLITMSKEDNRCEIIYRS